ncbi:C-type lectin domain-containing protein [Caenorhabditis elegans]|uniref:C-type lectin domain-containing protein n=1 Tax=Caenorhabditis elegans TaxID=6239 RepID=G5EDV2_CAEEL|nr:C-type lectin domain-containing protein [Caenorhabditis elegans]CAB04132.3 C-type lectin domain-containing protein [Caenorhabditis elegans]|eukprot:NP_507556.2 C-type LECtin [Caenorhabditis elegans]
MIFLFLIPVVNSCIPTQQVETTTTTTTSTTTTTPIPCPTGWEEFERPSGTWCIKTFAIVGSWQDGQNGCATHGAVLSGVQNQAELDFMCDSAVEGAFWVGGQRTAACPGPGLTATCTALTSFEWTDGSTTGTDGWIWRPIEPNNAASCPVINAWTYNLADQVCTRSDFDGYVCGKSPM